MFAILLRIALIVGPAVRVAGHAYVEKIVIAGAPYSGWLPFNDPYESPVPSRIVRKVPSDGPILDPFSADLACNSGGDDPAGAIADIQAGETVQFIWSRWPADHKGPITVWMASCGGSCSDFRSSSAKWFAIDKAGMNADGSYATDNLIAAGASWTTTIPSNIAPGEYLVRIELLALHSTGAPQFYPSCSQIRVWGTGTGTPGDGEAVSIQDIYKGYSFPDIWHPISVFEVAGPAVAAFVTGLSPASVPFPPSSTGAASSAYSPATTIGPPTASSVFAESVNFVTDPLPTTTRLCKTKLIRRKNTRMEIKQEAPAIDTLSFAHHKRNMAIRHREFSY